MHCCSKIGRLFQFLIGNLVTEILVIWVAGAVVRFQFLIGNLVTVMLLCGGGVHERFQFLIGNLVT